jgi:hypothetical protein
VRKMRTFIVPLAAGGAAFSVGKNSAELIWRMLAQRDRNHAGCPSFGKDQQITLKYYHM